MSAIKVKHNPGENRFEADVDGGTAIVEYGVRGEEITFTHTEVPKEAAGQGVAQALVRDALEYARDKKLTVIPECEYVATFVKRNSDYEDLLHPDYRHNA